MRHDTGFAVALDAALLARLQHGDREAFAAVYQCYARAAFGLALRMTAQPAAAEDLVHDVFLRAFERIASYRGDAPFGAWLKRMVVNAAIDRLRSERRWAIDAEALDLLDAPATDDVRQEALGLLARLPAAARAVVWLHEMEGYSHGDIAALFGHSESWSKSLLARSLQRLRGQLQEDAG